MSARLRELFGLIPVSLLICAGFAAVLTTETTSDVSDATLTYGAFFLGLCVLGHMFIRARLPDADPYMFPLAALLAAVGLVEIYRIDPDLAREQAQWFVVGLAFFCGTIVFLRDHHSLERYRYTIAAASILLLMLPRAPGIGAQVNGAFLAIKLGPIQFQPAEFAKLGIIVFLASYLREVGDVLVRPRLRPPSLQSQIVQYGLAVLVGLLLIRLFQPGLLVSLSIVVFLVSLVAIVRERPSLKHFGPLLLIWGLSMLMLIFIRDLGSSLMFFGAFLALLYLATARLPLVGVGASMFAAGSVYFANHLSHVHSRVLTWLDTFSTERVRCPSTGQVTEFVNCQGYQIAQGLFAQADGGLFGQGFGQALLDVPGGGTILPAPHTDLIYAVIANELGLFGAAGLVIVYLLFAARGYKTAMLANDGFSKLLAAGLTSVLCLQVFVIVGGVTRVIPLTGVTLPFVSYGGSSIVANMVLLALLLIVSDHARDERARRGGSGLNRQITQLFVLVGVMFAVLVGFTSYWTVLDANGLEDNSANRRPLIEAQKVPRGLILARDGTVLARSRATGRGEDRVFTRFYPPGPLFSHSVGYSFIERGRAGLEQSYDDDLAGREDEFESVLSGLENRKREGADVVTNLDPDGQRTAISALAGRPGSIVAIEPQTGKVRVMAVIPDFNPNDIPGRFNQLNRDPASPLLNRSTQARYQPGSTFKVVTAAAALDSGKYTPNSVVDGSSPKTIGGVPLSNSGGESFGPISLTDALTNSVNTVWAQVGESLGKNTMYKYMQRFGFNSKPPLDYPRQQMDSSGVFSNGRLLDESDAVDIGRVAIGQERLQVTPVQMAMVAAAVANGGKLIKPRFVDRIVSKDGRVKRRIEPDLQSQVISKKAADELTQMMGRVVEEGTGTAAALEGIKVAGKTGTAEVANGTANQAWFIAFAPIDNPRMAIAVTVERTSGQGGTVAAPLAKQVLEVLLK